MIEIVARHIAVVVPQHIPWVHPLLAPKAERLPDFQPEERGLAVELGALPEPSEALDEILGVLDLLLGHVLDQQRLL